MKWINDSLIKEKTIVPGENEEEIWLPLKAPEGFEISSFGQIKSKTGKIRKKTLDKNGYEFIYVKGKNYKIHKLVAEAFLDEPEKDQCCIDHIDKCRNNNYYKNLRFVNYSDSNKNRFYNTTTFINHKNTPIVLMDNDTHLPIQYFESIKQAAEVLNLSEIQISANIHGKRSNFKIGYFELQDKNGLKNLTK